MLPTTLLALRMVKVVFAVLGGAGLRLSYFFKEENNSLELTRIFKENIITDSEREKKCKGGEER